jgi:hypothetical protein
MGIYCELFSSLPFSYFSTETIIYQITLTLSPEVITCEYEVTVGEMTKGFTHNLAYGG